MPAPRDNVLPYPEPSLLQPWDRASIAAFALSLHRATVEFAQVESDRCAAAFIAVSGRAVRFDRDGGKIRLRAMRGGTLATSHAVEDLVPVAKAYLVPGAEAAAAPVRTTETSMRFP